MHSMGAVSRTVEEGLDHVVRNLVTITLLTLVGMAVLYPYTAEAAFISGVVLDSENGQPLANANIRVVGTQRGVATDLDGRFLLQPSPLGKVSLEISNLGYATHTEELVVTVEGIKDLTVFLISDPVELDQVVYTATRTIQLLKNVPVATELITSKDIEQSEATTVSEALQNEIGIDIREDFAGQGVTIQGMDPERVLVLVDGSRVIGRVDGSIDLNQLSTQDVQQIEIVKGAVSTLYGSEAIGGVINVITSRNTAPFSLGAQVSGGGYIPSQGNDELNRTRIHAPIAGSALDLSLGSEKTRFRSGLRFDTNDIMDSDPSTAHTEGVEGADKVTGFARLSHDITPPATLTLGFRTNQEEKLWIEDAGLQSVQVAYDDEEFNRRVDLSAELDCRPGWAEVYSLKIYRSQNTHDWAKYTQTDNRIRRDFSESDEEYLEIGGQATRNFGAAHRVIFGADVYWWDIEAHNLMSSALRSDFNAKINAWDAFVQDEFILNPRFTLVPGVRYEQHEVYGVHISPKISAMWKPWDSIRVRSSVGRGYRAPSSKELYYTFNHASAGYIVRGNPDLEPETSISYTFSVEHTYKDRSTSRISMFYNDMENLIDFDSLGVTEEFYTGIYQYENIVSAWTRGVEIERTFLVGNNWRYGIAYSYLETRNRETDQELMRRPKHSARFLVNWHPEPWNFRLWARYTGAMWFQDRFGTDDQVSNEQTNPYTLWNLAVSRELPHGFRAACKLENLFDETDARYGPYRGRTALFILSYNYSTQQ